MRVINTRQAAVTLIATAVVACLLAWILVPILAYGITFELGNLGPMEKGMSRPEVMRLLRQSGIEEMEPEPDGNLKVSDPTKLYSLNGASGICGKFGRGTYIEASFDANGKVVFISTSESIVADADVKTRGDLLRLFQQLARTYGHVVASGCVPQSKWISLGSFGALHDFYKHDTWRYRVPGSHSTVDIHFHRGKLEGIAYRWMPFEL